MMREIAGTASFVEPEATRRIYAQIAAGGADTCNCLPCRNFRLVRDAAYPPEFCALLDELGVDYRKELEVYGGEPLADGTHVYDGWFCFAGKTYGRAVSAPQGEGVFQYRITDTAPSPQRQFDGRNVLYLAFRTNVPWRLPEPWTLEGLPKIPVT
jgi:hypothetical protein